MENSLGLTDIYNILAPDGYELMTANCHTYRAAKRWITQYFPDFRPVRYRVIPLNFRMACDYVNRIHRHHPAPQGYKFAIGVTDGINILGVAMAGRPVCRHLDDGWTLEITRLCAKLGFKNICSLLYSRVVRIAREMGYSQVITYTLDTESGTSLKAAGFQMVRIGDGGSWNGTRKRIDRHPLNPKKLWRVSLPIY